LVNRLETAEGKDPGS